jgi:hypothetical protein
MCSYNNSQELETEKVHCIMKTDSRTYGAAVLHCRADRKTKNPTIVLSY